jgi:hypothetical protein
MPVGGTGQRWCRRRVLASDDVVVVTPRRHATDLNAALSRLLPRGVRRRFERGRREERTCSVNELTELSASDRVELRALVAEIDSEVAALIAQGAVGGTPAQVDTLAGSWARLTRLIALEPAPAERTCPHCKRRVMRAATRCLHCWKRSEPEALAP